MSTRKTASKTASKTPAAKPAKTAPKAQDGVAAAAARRGASVATAKPRAAASKPAAAAPTGEARYRWIAHAAYLRAEKRGFAPGREVDDWLAAEADFRAAYGGS